MKKLSALGAIRTHDPRIRNPVLYPPELRGRRTIAIAYQGGRIQRHGVCVRVRTSGPARKSESFLREPRSHVSHVGPRNRSVRRPSGDDSRGVPADHVYPPNQRLAAPGRGDVHARRRWYGGLRAGAAHGKATARFLQRKYEEAAILFETADQLDPRRRARPFLSRVERSLVRRPRSIRRSVGVPVTHLRAVRAGHTGDRIREA
jgi:hypothetical protein